MKYKLDFNRLSRDDFTERENYLGFFCERQYLKKKQKQVCAGTKDTLKKMSNY